MALLNNLMTILFNAVFAPFRGLDPIWSMLAVSLVTGVVMVWIFGKTSNQKAITAVKNRISGNLLAVRLFQDDIRVVLGINARILRYTGIYFLLSLVPMIYMLVPVLLLLTQLNLNFAYRSLEAGETVILTAKLRDAAALEDLANIRLELPGGVVAETPGVREWGPRPSVTWRLRVVEGPGGDAVIRIGNEEVRKRIQIGKGWTAVSALRTGGGLWEQLLWPGEDPLPAGNNFRAVEIAYPELNLSLFGFSINWLVLFFILSLVFGFAFKDVLGVKI